MAAGLVQSPAWQELLQHRKGLEAASLRDLVLADPERLNKGQVACGGLRLNFALNFITPKTIELLAELAVQQKLEEQRARLFGGDRVNISEKRAALHTALRQ